MSKHDFPRMSEPDFPEADYTGVELRIVNHLLKTVGFYPMPLNTISKLLTDFVSESSTPEIRAQRKTIVFGFVYGSMPAAELVSFLEDRLNEELERNPCHTCAREHADRDSRCASGNCPD